jgi:hypothetical protein
MSDRMSVFIGKCLVFVRWAMVGCSRECARRLDDRAAIWTAPCRGENGFGALGAGHAPIRQLRTFAASSQLLVAAVQPTTTDQIAHAEGVRTGTRPDRNDGAKEQEGIDHPVNVNAE